jgi:hypothetical protein
LKLQTPLQRQDSRPITGIVLLLRLRPLLQSSSSFCQDKSGRCCFEEYLFRFRKFYLQRWSRKLSWSFNSFELGNHRSSYTLEVLACGEALSLETDLGCTDVILASDCKGVLQDIQNCSGGANLNMIQQIKDMSTELASFSVIHEGGERNRDKSRCRTPPMVDPSSWFYSISVNTLNQ